MITLSIKNVLFYNYSTCEITLTLAWGLPHRYPTLQSPPGLGPIKTRPGPGSPALRLTGLSLGSKCLLLTSCPGLRGCPAHPLTHI